MNYSNQQRKVIVKIYTDISVIPVICSCGTYISDHYTTFCMHTKANII